MKQTTTATRKPATSAAEQREYTEASAAYLLVQGRLAARIAPIVLPAENASDEEFAVYDSQIEAIRADLGADAAFTRLHKAEDALLAWGHEAIRALPQYQQSRIIIDDLFSRTAHSMLARKKLLALLMQLDASGVAAAATA